MQYFKHSELVTNYRVSLKTVHNWIAAAKQGKLDLQLHEQAGRTYVANVPVNTRMLKGLSEKGKKYRNTLHHKAVTPQPRFYELFNHRQILDIIHNLDIHHEIPRQYSYFDGGATSWDEWIQRLQHDDTPSTFTSTVKLLHDNFKSIDVLIKGHKRVNVIDIGVGNAQPVKELLAHLSNSGILNRYIGIDISQEMLNIAEYNIKKWFGDSVKFEGHIRDISYERFDDLLIDDMLSDNSEDIVNLVLVLGATPVNFRSPHDVLRTIYGSMGHNDLIIYTAKPDSQASREYFDFNVNSGAKGLSPTVSIILELMDIDESLYDVEMGFNEQKRMRFIQIRLKTALTINFLTEHGHRDTRLEKGDAILLQRSWHWSALETISNFEEIGFKLLQSNLTKDRQFLMTISGVNAKVED